MQPIPASCKEDGAENHKRDCSLARDDSFSRMLAASKLQTSRLDASMQPVPQPLPLPLPPPLRLPPSPRSSTGKACGMLISPTLPSKPTPQLERTRPTSNGAGLDESNRRPEISGLRVWGGPASHPPTPTLSPPTGRGERLNGKRAWMGKISQTLSSECVPSNTWKRRNLGRLPTVGNGDATPEK